MRFVSNWFTTVYFGIRSWELEYGRFFDEKDILARRKVAVLVSSVANELFSDDNAVGRTVRIRNIPFTVVGVLKSKVQTRVGEDQDDIILTPSATVLYRLKGRKWVNRINASAISTEYLKPVKEEIRHILRESHQTTSPLSYCF